MPRGSVVIDLTPPKRGAISAEAPHLMPEDAVDADNTKNVVMRDGKLVNRPGLVEAIPSQTVNSERSMGAIFYRDISVRRTVVATTAAWYYHNSTAWTSIGSWATAGTADDHARFVVWPTGTANVLIGVNGALRSVPKEWDGTTFQSVAGSPNAADDITVASNRVVLARTLESSVEQLYRIRWSGFNDRTSWPAANFVDLSDTFDPIIGARALNRTAFAVYKEASQWVGLATAGQWPYRFELQDQKPGPASAGSVVTVEGRHYYLGQDGSFYQFDGLRCTHIGEPIRRYVLANLNFAHKKRIFGVFFPYDRDIWWFFPSGGGEDPDAAISMNIDSMRFFPHTLGAKVSCGTAWDIVASVAWNDLAVYTWNNIADTYPTWDSFGSASVQVDIVGGIAGKIYNFGTAATDDGTAVSAQWRVGPRAMAGAGKRLRVQSMDTFFDQTAVTQNCIFRVGSTDTLAQDPTFPSELSDTEDLSSDVVHRTAYDTATTGYGSGNAEARFHAVDHLITTTTPWAWNGAVLRGYSEETGNN